MQMLRALPVVLLSVLGSVPAARAARTNPLGKILTLLDEFAHKVKADGAKEEEAHKAYEDWCDNTLQETGHQIKSATAQQEKLEAKIIELSSEIERADTSIEELAKSISTSQAELKEATAIREKELADFLDSEKELMEVVDALDRAITILEDAMQKNSASLAQLDSESMTGVIASLSVVVDAASFTNVNRDKLIALVQSQQEAADGDTDDSELASKQGAPKSASIVEVLEDLKDKADVQLGDVRKAETNKKNNYQMMKQSLEDKLNADNQDMDEEKATASAAKEGKATAEGDLEVTKKELTSAKHALEETSDQCQQAHDDHEASQKSRVEELKVLAEVKKILEETTGGASEQTYSFLQVRASAKAELRTHSRAELARNQVVNLVKRLAKEHHSAALAQLASRIAAVVRYGAQNGDDPFAKIKGLITDLIDKLEKEMMEESTEKAYCDEEMAKTKAQKDDLTDEVDKLSAKIGQNTAKRTDLTEEVKELQAALSVLAKEQAEIDKIRANSHEAYVAAKKDLELGISGVRKALSVLREYYAKKEDESSLLQDSKGFTALMQQPAMLEEKMKGDGAGATIVSFLEVIEQDFADNLAKIETQEADEESEHAKVSEENKMTETVKSQDVKFKSQEIKALEKSIAEMSADRDTSNTELAAVLEYWNKLKARCVAKPEAYEERKKRREAEIQGLKEALTILEGEASFAQRKMSRGRRHGNMRGALA